MLLSGLATTGSYYVLVVGMMVCQVDVYGKAWENCIHLHWCEGTSRTDDTSIQNLW